MAYEQEKKLMKDQEATLVDLTSLEQLEAVELTRQWDKIRDDQRATVLAAADQFVSTLNSCWCTGCQYYAVTTPYADGVQWPGTWRLVTNALTASDETRPGMFGLVQKLRRGYVTSLTLTTSTVDGKKVVDFTGIARVKGQELSDGNDSCAVAACTDTKSSDPEHILTLAIPYVSPQHEQAIMAALGGVAGYATDEYLKIENQLYIGPWHSVMASSSRQDDGSITIEWTLARPEYVLNSYTDFGTMKEGTVAYLWQIPKERAQAIITQWRTTHPVASSASAQYNASSRMVDLILRTKAEVGQDWATGWVALTCDTSERQFLGFGLTETEAKAFIALHDELPPTDTLTDPVFCTSVTDHGAAGFTRDLSVSDQGDGLYNVTITERYVQFDAAKHIFPTAADTDYAFSGTRSTTRRLNGWHVPIAHLEEYRNLFTTPHDIDTPDRGNKVTSFQVTRRDDCTFDFEAVTVTHAAISANMCAASGGGIQYDATAYANQVDLSVSSGPRVRYNLSPSLNDHGSLDGIIEKTTVPCSCAAACACSGTANCGVQVISIDGRNQDAGWLGCLIADTTPASPPGVTGLTQAMMLPGYAKRIGVKVAMNEDGTEDSGLEISILAQISDSLCCSGCYHRLRNTYYGHNACAVPTLNCMDRILYATVNGNDDGSVSYLITVEDAGLTFAPDCAGNAFGLVFERYLPLATQYGYVDEAVMYSNIPATELMSYGLGTCYGEIRSLRREDDNTYTMVQILRTYNCAALGTGGTELMVNTTACSYVLDRYWYDCVGSCVGGRAFTFCARHFTSYADALGHICGGLIDSDISVVRAGVNEYYRATKVTTS